MPALVPPGEERDVPARAPASTRFSGGRGRRCVVSAAEIVHVPPLTGTVDLSPAVLPAELIDDPAHLGALDVDRATEFMRGGAGRVGRRGLARQKRVVELRLLLVGAV